LHDPYTGQTIRFRGGVGTLLAVQIDHVVALADAWRTGASRWTANKRLRYANDLVVLLAVDGPTNGAKSDDDASESPARPYPAIQRAAPTPRAQPTSTRPAHDALDER
jgi:hypothetical protein